jgi:hypothetical protein
MEIRAAELTADHLGRTVKIDRGDQGSSIGRLVRIQHRRAGDGGDQHAVRTRSRRQSANHAEL